MGSQKIFEVVVESSSLMQKSPPRKLDAAKNLNLN